MSLVARDAAPAAMWANLVGSGTRWRRNRVVMAKAASVQILCPGET